MPPDINILTPSESPNPSSNPSQPTSRTRMVSSQSPITTQSPTRLPPHLHHDNSSHVTHSPPATSLAAAAALNAGLQHEERNPASGTIGRTPTSERRRSSIRMSLSLNDPSLPAPGEVANTPGFRARLPSGSLDIQPHHGRTPSLGELHQELENEQEAHVNRLLGMIRQQQAQLQALQSHGPTSSSTAIDDGTTSSDVSRSQTPSQSHTSHRVPQRISTSRHSSQQHISHSSSPLLRAQHGPLHLSNTNIGYAAADDHNVAPSSAVSSSSLRDESAFYVAETQNLTRENQMLKARIRELERQLLESEGPAAIASHTPATHSTLTSTVSPEQESDVDHNMDLE